LTADERIDAAATTTLRATMRWTRLAEAEPARIATRPQIPPSRPTKPIYGPLSLAKSGNAGVFVCNDCGNTICPPYADFHDYAPSRLRSPASLGHTAVRADWQAYREYYCPSCGTMLDVSFEETAETHMGAK